LQWRSEFEEIDLDKDGQITFQELMHVLREEGRKR
jgi:Ca2+-binding EF-hand superfamily protein